MKVEYRPLMALWLAVLAACSPNSDASSGEGTSAAAPATIEKAAAPDPAPTLERVSRFDAERELSSGAGCELIRDGGALLIAVGGDAIAKPSDKLVHLRRSEPDPGSLARGGRFEAGTLSITVTIDPAGTPGKPVGETLGRPAQVTVTRGAASADFDAQWTCGA